MKVKITVRLVLHKSEMVMDFPEGSTVENALARVAGLTNERVRGLLFDFRGKPIVLTLVNGRSVAKAETLKDGDHLAFWPMSPAAERRQAYVFERDYESCGFC